MSNAQNIVLKSQLVKETNDGFVEKMSAKLVVFESKKTSALKQQFSETCCKLLW